MPAWLAVRAMFALLEPSAGEVTVQMSGADPARAQQLLVFEVEGLAGIGAIGPRMGGTKVNNLALSVATTRPDGGVLHIVTRYDGSEANPIALTGVDWVLPNGASGPHATYDLTVCIGWSRAMAPGIYASNATWTDGKTVMGTAIEMLSAAP